MPLGVVAALRDLRDGVLMDTPSWRDAEWLALALCGAAALPALDWRLQMFCDDSATHGRAAADRRAVCDMLETHGNTVAPDVRAAAVAVFQ